MGEAQVDGTRAMPVVKSDKPNDNEVLRDAWTTWLSQTSWTWFFTGTFKRDMVTSAGALHFARKWFSRLPYGARAFMGAETSKRGVFHVHGLIYSPGASWCDAVSWWQTRLGRIRLENYDSRYGAAKYVTKYVLKGCSDKGDYELLQK